MPLDPAANFVRDALQSAVADTDTTFSVSDAAQFPDPSTDGEFNVVVWDAANNPRPDQDPDVEIVRVTAVDTGANELTVTRAQENTTAASHPIDSGVLLAPTAKDTSDTVAALNARPESPVGVSDLADGLGTGESSRLGGTTYLNSHDSLEATEKVHNGVVYAGHPDFSTLQEAVDFAESNTRPAVLVPPGDYGGITISMAGLHLFGAGGSRNTDPVVNIDSIGVNASDVILERFRLTNADITINNQSCVVRNVSEFIGGQLVIDTDNCRITHCTLIDIVVSGSNNVVVANTSVQITDNGTNNQIGSNT